MTIFSSARAAGFSAALLFSAAAPAQDASLEARVDTLAQDAYTLTQTALRQTQQARPGGGGAVADFIAISHDPTAISGNHVGMISALTRDVPTIRDSRLRESLEACFRTVAPGQDIGAKTRTVEACTARLRQLSTNGFLEGATTEQVNALEQRATAARAEWRLQLVAR